MKAAHPRAPQHAALGAAPLPPGRAGAPVPDRRAPALQGAGESVRAVQGDWVVLVRLFERASPVSMSHWNPQTGKTFELPRGKQRRVTGERFEQRLMNEEGQAADWAEIPCEESDTEYRRAVTFAEELRPGAGRAELLSALQGPKPFRAFRAVLARHPGLERRWTAVSARAAEERLAEFCLAQGWRLADPRFDLAVERWLDAQESQDGGAELEDAAPAQLVMRTMGQLSLGRRAPNHA